jgi:hypothetical protein
MTYNNHNRKISKNKKSRCIICAKSTEVDKLQNDSDYCYDELDIKCKACDVRLDFNNPKYSWKPSKSKRSKSYYQLAGYEVLIDFRVV